FLRLFGFQGFHELAAKILLLREDTKSFPRTGPDFTRIGAQERRCASQELAIHNGEIRREMVALNAPTPRPFGRRGAEQAEIIEFAIAWEATGCAFHIVKNVFETHDVGGFFVAVPA